VPVVIPDRTVNAPQSIRAHFDGLCIHAAPRHHPAPLIRANNCRQWTKVDDAAAFIIKKPSAGPVWNNPSRF
jgi:hypothetical protein